MAQKHNADYAEKPMTRDGKLQGPSRRYRRLRHPNFPAAEWAVKNPLLQRGEIGIEIDTNRIKVGNGYTLWNDLPYAAETVTAWGSIGGDINDQADLINMVDGKVAAEATARENADIALGARIDGVINDLSTETTARENADLGLQNQINTNKNTMDGHIANTSNPHQVTKAQVGLSNVDNTADLDKPISTVTQTALDGKQNVSAANYQMGNASGGWTAMTAAQQNALNSGATTTNIGQIATNTTSIANEIIDRQNADNGLQSQIDAIVSKSDVVDIVGTYAELQAYDTSTLGNNDVVKVLDDSTHNDAQSYYRWVITGGVGAWVYIGSEAETYTKAQTDALLNGKQNTISDLATIRSGAALGATAVQPGDLATVATSGSYDDLSDKPTIGNGTLTVQANGTTVATFGANQTANTTANITVPTDTSDLTNTAGFITSAALTPYAKSADLATVATSGSYNDLTNKPTIPAAQVNADWNANSGVAQILNKPTLGTAAAANTTDFATAAQGALADTAVQPADLATVATSGSYTDLSDKPTIPTVNNATLTIQRNGAVVQTFTANQATNATANIAVPTATSQITNDSGFITSAALPTVNNPTITITQGGVTKGSFTLNQATDETIALDAGGGSNVDIDNSTITKNASDEIQAVATVNANTAAGATNPVYDWVGTLAEYTAQNIATTHPDWLCYITDDNTAQAFDAYSKTESDARYVQQGHQVIDFQEPTSSNGYTWYRKYADGWVEQGGRVQLNGQISSTNKRVSFPITMANAAYFSLASQDANTPYTSFVGWQGTTGMSVGTNGASTTGTTSWLVCGMAA